ncbi:sigma-70 family RNA polymerase sigma factor [Aeoliella mucimassa]|uniref:RNA polymerase sigma factor n=1 Tax=Aeoliella mucimassa TaxID=2527972 RepID=A0A518AVE8_9BACT|nr:sigma-70 family RNA polymerase sigma factor [Aeoliella mucimassa]QDU58709.1 RNA polymerase sigma factor [Aeoliella mucimassa]
MSPNQDSDESSSLDQLSKEHQEHFVQLLTDEQSKLLNYIAMLLGDPHAARNVLQEANLVIWRKAAEFELGTSFTAWSRKIAFWQAQAYARDRHVFSDELMEQIANRNHFGVADQEEASPRIALRHCLSQLNRSHLELLRERYEEDTPISELAKRTGKTPSAVKVGLMRLRRVLLKCIRKELAFEGT